VTVHHADVGPTKEWSWPKDIRKSMAASYWQYLRSVWKLPNFRHLDVILIDRRFRVRCFLASISKITQPTRILFDDYTGRDAYHIAETFFSPLQIIGRMAVFDATPRRLSFCETVKYLKPGLYPV